MKDKYFSISLPRGSKEARDLMAELESHGSVVIDICANLEQRYHEVSNVRKRPLLVLILGSSNLSQGHQADLENVIGDRTFDSLDFLVQVVSGDVKVGYNIAKFLRSRVTGTLTSLVPVTVSGAGTILTLTSDEIIGGEFTYVLPAEVSSIHPSIIHWRESTGETPPMYGENNKEYEKFQPEGVDLTRQLLQKNASLTNGRFEELAKYLAFSDDVEPEQAYRFVEFLKIGIKARLAEEREKSIFTDFQEIIPLTLDDHILLIEK